MFSAVARVFAIALAVVFLAGMAVVFMRWTGSQQTFEAPPHPWFSEAAWTIDKMPIAELCAEHPKAISKARWLVPVRYNPELDQWRVDCPLPLPLAGFLNRHTNLQLVLEVEAKDSPRLEGWLDDLVRVVSEHSKSTQIGVWAPAQKIARYLRKQAPEWVFAADSGALLRLHLLSSLWLEPAMEFWPDFVIASHDQKSGQALNQREVQELHRRQKRVLWMEPTPPPFTVDGSLIDRGK